MSSTEREKTFIIPLLLTVLLTALMTGAAEIFHDNEIIFPEIAALATGYLYAPKRAWQVNSVRMFCLISGCAVIGFLISVFLPWPLYLKVLVAFIIAQMIYIYSGTTLAPLISAVVLPVLIGTRSVSYIFSAVVMTLLIILCRQILVRAGIREDEPFVIQKKPDREAFRGVLLRTAVVAILLIPAISLGWRYLAAPPLLVAFTELTAGWTPKSEKKPLRVILLLTGCAAIGAASRYFLTVRLGLPLALSAALAVLVMLLILRRTSLFMPPAGAMTVLAMLIPEEALGAYVPEVFAAITIFMLVTVLYRSRAK